MIDIFTKTDIADINSFLKLKVSNQILSLTQLILKWYFQLTEETSLVLTIPWFH